MAGRFYLIVCMLICATSLAVAEFTSKVEMWRAAEYDALSSEWDVETPDSALTLVMRWHMAGETGPQARYDERILELSGCIGSEDGKLVWAKKKRGNVLKTCTDCSVTRRLWPGAPNEPPKPESLAELGLENDWDSFVLRWLQAQRSSYSFDQPENLHDKAILTCNCAGERGQPSSLDLDTGIYISDDDALRLHCSSLDVQVNGDDSAIEEAGREIVAKPKRSILLPSVFSHNMDIHKELDMDKTCADWRVVDSSSGNRSLLAYCPVQGLPKNVQPLYAISKLDLDDCLVNDNGTLRFQEQGNGMPTCEAFFDTRGTTKWTTRCQADFFMPNSTSRASITDGLNVMGRFKWKDHSLSCFPSVRPADTIVPLDWACKNVSLSRDVPGVITADCPANLGLDKYERSTINLNRCIGLNSTEPGWPVAKKDGNAFENCKDCELTWRNDTIGSQESKKTVVKSAVLTCTCRTESSTTFLKGPTVFIPLQEHVGWSPSAFRPVCLNGTIEGNKLINGDS